jgi:cysteinyl-tRNA synthetase
MTARLIAKGHAYAAEGHVLFDVGSFPAYGRLSRRALDEMVEGARVEVAPFKRNPHDFVLWKPSAPDQPGWESPWGRGRPGWHIECSAMAEALLGQTFDIHGGGIDLVFPHHENEIAQSCCAHGTETMAQVWMHNGFLEVEGRKMSKSLGNFFTVRDLLEKGHPGEVIRFVLLSTHYRKPMDWTARAAEEAERTLAQWRTRTDEIDPSAPSPGFLALLQNDLNTPAAIAALHKLFQAGDLSALRASAQLLGLLGEDLAWACRRSHGLFAETLKVSGAELGETTEVGAHRELVERLLKRRAQARAGRDFAEADRLRDGLSAAGVLVKDTAAGPVWELAPGFDPAKLEGLA